MTDPEDSPDEPTEGPPSFLSSLPDRPLTEEHVRQIGESDHPRIRGAMGLPTGDPTSIEAFQLDLEATTHVLVFDPGAERWRSYASFDTEGLDHDEIAARATERCNEWLGESLADRIEAAERRDG